MTDKNEKKPLSIEEMENISGGRNDAPVQEQVSLWALGGGVISHSFRPAQEDY